MTTNNQTEALKPCPFCGSDRVDPTSDDGLHWVRCRTCGATGPEATKYSDEDEPDWNSRALSATAAPVQQEPFGYYFRHSMGGDGMTWSFSRGSDKPTGDGLYVEKIIPLFDRPAQAAPQQEVVLDCIEFDASGKLASADVIVNGERVKLGTQAHMQESERQAFEKWFRAEYDMPDWFELNFEGIGIADQFKGWQARAALGPVAAPVVPDGFKLVPIEPTDRQIEAGNNVGNDVVATYRAMLSAAPVAPVVPDTDRKDAERWRALIGSARIRPLGCAGIKEREASNYAHLGLELWTVFGGSLNDEQRERLAKENALGREWLTAYADIAAISAAKNPERGSEG